MICIKSAAKISPSPGLHVSLMNDCATDLLLFALPSSERLYKVKNSHVARMIHPSDPPQEVVCFFFSLLHGKMKFIEHALRTQD